MEAFSFSLPHAFSFAHFFLPPPMCAPYSGDVLPVLYVPPVPPAPPDRSNAIGEEEEEEAPARARDVH